MSPTAGASIGRQLDLDGPAAPSARSVDAGVDDDRCSQASKRSGSRSVGQIPPGADEALLDRVSCELGVPEDEAGRRVQPHDERAGELGEGVMIALLVPAPRALAGPRSPSASVAPSR